MEENKKEKVMWICILGVVALFILFMPEIESTLAGRKVKPSKEQSAPSGSAEKLGDIEITTYPTLTTCSLAETLNEELGAKVSKEVKFTYNTSGTVTNIHLVSIYKYTDVAIYNNAASKSADNKIGIKETITKDDANMALTVTDEMSISEMQEVSEYPTGYNKLKDYLNENNYTCTETK